MPFCPFRLETKSKRSNDGCLQPPHPGQGGVDRQTVHHGALMSLVALSLASTLIAFPSQITPEQFLRLAKENLCGSFLRFPRVDALLVNDQQDVRVMVISP